MFQNFRKLAALATHTRMRPVEQEQIDAAQAAIDMVFPKQLIAFWLEFGHGRIIRGLQDRASTGEENKLLAPILIPDILQGDSPSHLVPPEGFGGNLPFFSIGDQCFLCIDAGGYVLGVGGQRRYKSLHDFMEALAVSATCYRDPTN